MSMLTRNDRLGKIILVHGLVFKDQDNYMRADARSLVGRPCLIVEEHSDKLYVCPINVQQPNERYAKKYEVINIAKNKKEKRNFYVAKDKIMTIEPVGYHEMDQLSPSTYLKMIKEIIKFNVRRNSCEQYQEIQNNLFYQKKMLLRKENQINKQK